MGKIERSTGIQVPGWYGPRPGGGYEGSTRELDRDVEKDAEWLSEQFPEYHVEIRFNSDRLSGGAYLSNGKIRMDESIQAGISTDIRDQELHHHVYANQELLVDPSDADQPSPSGSYASPYFSTAAKARRWFLKHVDREKIAEHIPKEE